MAICGERDRKPVEAISDRAKRYRAHQPECAPRGPKRCALCASRRFLVIDHIDGNESNGRPSNLQHLCKSCNTIKGLHEAKSGRGVRTRQSNPAELGALLEAAEVLSAVDREFARWANPPTSGARNLAEYLQALAILKGDVPGDFERARQTIHNTPASRRSDFAHRVWAIRRERGTDTWSSAVPF